MFCRESILQTQTKSDYPLPSVFCWNIYTFFSGINNTPLHEHQQADKTLSVYIVPVTRFVAALLRHSSTFQFPKSSPAVNALKHLQQRIDNREEAHHQLHSLFQALWLTNWKATTESQFPDPTLCFLALFCLRKDGSFSQPKDVTQPIAKLCRAIQLTVITHIHLLCASEAQPDQMSAMDALQDFVVEKRMTTFNSLMSLQHYASSLAFSTMSLPHVWWLDREKWQSMMFKGHRINMKQLGTIFDNIDSRIVHLWETKLTFGLGLSVDYDAISDNLLDSQPGYCFLDDDRNPFAQHKDTLITAILTSPELCKQFTVQIAETPHRQLNTHKCREYMGYAAEFDGLVMVSAHMKGGAPPRGTELSNFLFRNTLLRLRNTMALGNTLAVVRQYDKTGNITQKDRLIPHAIDAFTADLIIQSHTFVRPFLQVSSPVIQ